MNAATGTIVRNLAEAEVAANEVQAGKDGYMQALFGKDFGEDLSDQHYLPYHAEDQRRSLLQGGAKPPSSQQKSCC